MDDFVIEEVNWNAQANQNGFACSSDETPESCPDHCVCDDYCGTED